MLGQKYIIFLAKRLYLPYFSAHHWSEWQFGPSDRSLALLADLPICGRKSVPGADWFTDPLAHNL